MKDDLTLVPVDEWVHPKEKIRREDEAAADLRYAESPRKGSDHDKKLG